MVQNCLDVPEDNPRLVFVFRQAHDGQGLTDGDKWLEIDKASDETGDQSRDEGFPTPTANYEVRFLRTTDGRRYSSGMAAKYGEVIGGHGQTENGLQYHQSSCPRIELSETRQRAKEFPVPYRVYDGDLFRHK